MGTTAPPKGPFDTLEDQELLERYRHNPSDKRLGEELYSRCLARIDHTVRMYAFQRRHCLPQDRNRFIIVAMSKAADKLTACIDSTFSAKELNASMIRLARNAAMEEHRILRRRGITWEQSREEKFRSKHHRDPFNFLRELKDEGLVNALLTVHGEKSKQDEDSACSVRMKLEESYTVAEIAIEYGNTKEDVFRTFDHDSKELQRILEDEFNIPVESL